MILPRILTAVIGVPLVVAAVHLGGMPYMTLMAAVIAVSLYEYVLILRIGKKPVHTVSLIIFGLLMAVIAVLSRAGFQGQPDNLVPVSLNLVILGVFLFELLTPGRSFDRLAYTFLGVFLIPWNMAYLINIRDIRPHGEYITLMIFVTVWASDTAAYFAGKAIGRNKLIPDVSPKKTWEGAVAGFVFAIVASTVMRSLLIPDSMSMRSAAILGAVAGIVGQFSDLAESLIKRGVGVKDSSAFLPGHGGVLDRFDSYILLAPIYYFLAITFK